MRRQITTYLLRHLQAALNSIGKLSRSPTATLATCLVIGIALALPTALFITLKNAEGIQGSFQQTMQLTLYLKKQTSEHQALQLERELALNKNIKQVHAISPDAGLKELQQQAGFDDLLNNLQSNPLPWAIVVLPNTETPASLELLSQELKLLPEVETVQLDILWAKRLTTLLLVAHRITYALAVFLGIAVLLIVNNTIRSTTQSHQKEIEIIRLIGGTPAFIRRPFLYTGMIYGLLGGIIAWLLVDLLTFFLQSPINHLAQLYDTQFELAHIDIYNTFFLLGISILLGWIGSWFAVTKHLYTSK